MHKQKQWLCHFHQIFTLNEKHNFYRFKQFWYEWYYNEFSNMRVRTFSIEKMNKSDVSLIEVWSMINNRWSKKILIMIISQFFIYIRIVQWQFSAYSYIQHVLFSFIQNDSLIIHSFCDTSFVYISLSIYTYFIV